MSLDTVRQVCSGQQALAFERPGRSAAYCYGSAADMPTSPVRSCDCVKNRPNRSRVSTACISYTRCFSCRQSVMGRGPRRTALAAVRRAPGVPSESSELVVVVLLL